MEFIDPIVAEETTTKPQEGKTEKAVHQLEDEIDKAYNNVEKKFGDLWTNASKNAGDLQEKYKLEENRKQMLDQLKAAKDNLNDRAQLSQHLEQFETQVKSLSSQIHIPGIDMTQLNQQANNYLSNLDETIELVEKQAGAYVSQFTSFLSNIVSVDQGDNDKEASDEENKTLFTTANYGTSRFDNDLFKLHTNQESFLSDKLDIPEEIKKFNVDDKTGTISELLSKYETTLAKSMNDLVPVKIPYQLFWYRYFKLETSLKQQEEKRKQLLEKETSDKARDQDEDEEEFTWDDEDDEDTVDVGKSQKQ